jgi:LPXTG-site transpeptidase (sortase) family protein
LPPPSRVRIAAIGVDSALESLAVDRSGALQGPVDYAKAGWYAAGIAPGEVGPAVIAGHVDSARGPAVFYRLRDLKAGDEVEVARGDQWMKFRVVATEKYPKNQFPTDRVYRPTPVPELRLITCGGTFDRGRRSYEDNIVVYAVSG